MSKRFDKLTRKAMQDLEPGKRIVEGGIIYEKTKNGDGRFELCIQVNGKRMHRVIGNDSEGFTRTHAEEALEKFKSEARMDRLKLPKGRKLPMTFKEAATKYLQRLSEGEGRNLLKKTQQLNQYLIPFFGSTALEEISGFETERFKKHCREQGLSPSTVNRFLAVLSHLFAMAGEWGWIAHAPCKVKKYREEVSRITYLTPDQIQRLLEAAKEDSCGIIHPFILIGLETSMRKMEILSIRVENIDLRQRIIYIPQAKAGAREQPITVKLAEFLREYLKRNAYPGQIYLFPADSKTGHRIEIERPFRRVVKAAGLDPKQVIRHTLRHTAITHLVQAGVDLPTVKRISGHKSLQMVERYAHQNQDHIQAAMAKLEGRYR